MWRNIVTPAMYTWNARICLSNLRHTIQARSLYEYNAFVVNTESYCAVVYPIAAITVIARTGLNHYIDHGLYIWHEICWNLYYEWYIWCIITGIDHLSNTIGSRVWNDKSSWRRRFYTNEWNWSFNFIKTSVYIINYASS